MHYVIKMARGDTGWDRADTLNYRFKLPHEATNELARIGECAEQAGGTISGAGFALYAVLDGGEMIAYRVLRIDA